MSSPINILAQKGLDLWKVYKIKGVTLFKKFKFSKHALKIPPALAVDYEILREARNRGCQYIQLFDTENGEYYDSKISTMIMDGFKLNRGFNTQIALPLSKWTQSKNSSIPKHLTIEQISLFEDKNGR